MFFWQIPRETQLNKLTNCNIIYWNQYITTISYFSNKILILMMTVYQLTIYFILFISNDLREVSINTSVTLSFVVVLAFLSQTFGRVFFLARFILMSYFMLYIFLQLMLLVLMEGFCFNDQEGYWSLLFKDAV